MALAVTIGLDIAKAVIQVHAVDAAGQVVARRRLSRGRVLAFFEKPTLGLVGIEACNTSHYWARNSSHAGTMSGCCPLSMCGPKRSIVRFAPSSVVTTVGPSAHNPVGITVLCRNDVNVKLSDQNR